MIRQVFTVLAVLVVGAVAGATLATGTGPVAATGALANGVSSYAGTDTAADGGGGGGGAVAGTATPADSTGGDGRVTATKPFAFSVDSVESCGTTCRDVTTTLTNQQSTAATDVTVETRIYAGNRTDGDPVWTGTESVGRLDAGESYTTTERVDLSLTDAYAIEQNDGWITVETTVTSDGETVTMTERRNVN